MNNTIITISAPKTSVPCQFTSTSYPTDSIDLLSCSENHGEKIKMTVDILANLSRCLEHHVEALRTLLKGVLPFKTIIVISESDESRKRAFKSLKIYPRKYVASYITN